MTPDSKPQNSERAAFYERIAGTAWRRSGRCCTRW